MAKKAFVSAALLLSSCALAWGQTGYDVTYTPESSHQNMATITKSENGGRSLSDVITEINAKKINSAGIKKVKIVGDITSDAGALSAITCTTIDLSEATLTSFTNNNVKYVVLPNGWSKEQVNKTAQAIGNSLESAASALGNYTYSDGFEYTDPYTKEKVQVEKGKIQTKDNDTYGLLTGTFTVAPTKEESTYTYIDNGETKAYNGTLLFDKAGDAFGVKEGTALVSLFPDTYLADNANNRYTGTITRKEEGAIYGNTGTAFDVDFSLEDYKYSIDDKNYVYFGDDTYTNGEKLYSPINSNDNIVKLNKIEEYHSYGPKGELVNINDYTIESEERQWDNNSKAYYVIGKYKGEGNGIWLYIIDAYTYGEANTKYDTNKPVYTKGEEYYGYTSAENPFKELTELTEKTYFNVQTQEIYTGKVYDGQKGGTGEDIALTSVTDYYKDESKTQTQKYEGPVTTDNKGVEDAENYFTLTSAYVYTYNDLAGNERTKNSTVRMTEIQLTGDELYIAISSAKIQSEVPTNVSVTAYVKKPGTLVYSVLNMSQLESKYYDWFGNGIWYVDQTNNNYKYDYKAQKVKKIILSGNLNAIDLNGEQTIVSEEGHFVKSDGKNYGAWPYCSPDTLDLSSALFDVAHPEDMTISQFFPTLKSVLLPTDKSQKVIPADCFYNMYLKELMIPSHYEVIGERAFSTSHTLSHIYVKNCVTDSIYDHGDFTITLPESLKEIRSEGVESFDKATFSGNALEKVTDVYVMADPAPKCGKYAFNAAITYGNNGFAGNWTHPICRENYINGEKVIAVLHYPSTTKYNKENKKYTDVTREYTLNDETGMVDGNGELKVWPRHAEFVRSFKQAKEGLIWTDWQRYAKEGDTEVIMDNSNGQYTVAEPTRYDNENYQGWHEFVLSETFIAKPYNPQEHYEKFNQCDWYTICIPYDITKSMLLAAFGVNKEAKYKNKVKMFGDTEYKEVATVEGVGSDGWLYPDVRSLVQVKRSYKNLKVTLCLSDKLFTPEHCQEITIPENGQGYSYTDLTGDDPVILKAGMPYLIRPYVPVDTHIKNIGAYLCAYVSQFKDVKPQLFKAIDNTEKMYAVPSERGVETHALKLDASTENKRVYVMKDDGSACKYNFVGTYVDRYIPQYGYYLGKEKGTGKHKFFRTTKTTTKWNRYSSIITGMSTPDYVDNGAENAKDIKNIELQFKGLTDDLVMLNNEIPNNTSAGAKKMSIAFDDSGVNDLPTSIDEIDVEIALPENSRIYTINGTRVAGDRLQKGIYIKDGKKIVVK